MSQPFKSTCGHMATVHDLGKLCRECSDEIIAGLRGRVATLQARERELVKIVRDTEEVRENARKINELNTTLRTEKPLLTKAVEDHEESVAQTHIIQEQAIARLRARAEAAESSAAELAMKVENLERDAFRCAKRYEVAEIDTERLDALLFDDKLDLRKRREDGKWAAYNLETEKGYGPFLSPREAIDAYLAALSPRQPQARCQGEHCAHDVDCMGQEERPAPAPFAAEGKAVTLTPCGQELWAGSTRYVCGMPDGHGGDHQDKPAADGKLVWSDCVHGGLIEKGAACMYCKPAARGAAK